MRWRSAERIDSAEMPGATTKAISRVTVADFSAGMTGWSDQSTGGIYIDNGVAVLVDVATDNLEEAMTWVEDALARQEPKSIGLVANAAQARAAVFGYTCLNDVTARDLQRRDGQWTRGKGFDTFCPLGPWLETEFGGGRHAPAIRA